MILSLGALGAMAATTEQAGASTKPAMRAKKGMARDHMTKASEPHHVLAMAYHQNLAAFAKALHEQASSAAPVNVDFARAAVTEMRRSFDLMKQQHQEHMQTMSAEMHTKMSGMMGKMETHQTELNTQITALEQEVQSTTPDAKKASALATSVHTNLDAMSKMHQGC